MVLYPGDFVQYKRARQTTSYYISSEPIEDTSKNVNNIWSTFDYIVSGSHQNTTYISWPFEDRPIGSTSIQYPPISIFDLKTLYWWKITNVNDSSMTVTISSPTTEVEKVSSYVFYDTSISANNVSMTTYKETVYANRTTFSFTPTITGVYSIEVYAQGKNGSDFLFTNIPHLSVVPQFKDQEVLVQMQHPSSGFLLEQPLYGWNYNINRADSEKIGAKPYWAELYFQKDASTKFKGIQNWGYPNDYIEEYLPNHTPRLSPLELSYGSIVNYERIGYTMTWQQPIEFNTFVATTSWCKLNYDITNPSNLALIYPSKNRNDLTVYSTTEPSDIMLSNVLNAVSYTHLTLPTNREV
mgnify:CR=1 FL=1